MRGKGRWQAYLTRARGRFDVGPRIESVSARLLDGSCKLDDWTSIGSVLNVVTWPSIWKSPR